MSATVTLTGDRLARIVARAIVRVVGPMADRLDPDNPAAAEWLAALNAARAILAGPNRRRLMRQTTDRPIRPRPRPRPNPRPCPTCGNALLKYRGATYCPACPIPYRPA